MAFSDLFRKKEKLPQKTEAELRLHRCAFTGHRPERIRGLEADIIAGLRKEILTAIEDGYTTFITGCSRAWICGLQISYLNCAEATSLSDSFVLYPSRGLNPGGLQIGSSTTRQFVNRRTGLRSSARATLRMHIKREICG